MKRSKTKLLIPAVLVAGACTPTPAPKCGTETFHACWPDGGFACPSDCSAQKLADGGLDLDGAGMPQCFC